MAATYYRKNSKWTTVYVSISTDELEDLGNIVGNKVREQKNVKPNSRTWNAVDIVDTIVVSTSFNPSKEKTILDLLVYVADLTGKPVD